MAKKKKKSTIQRLAESTATRLENLEKLQAQVEEARTTLTEPPATDSYYAVNPATGLSQAQTEARAALAEAQNVRTELGLPGILSTPAGSAGSINTPPTTGLKQGYEWYAFNLPGGGIEWRQRPTKGTLTGAYTTLFGSGNGNGNGGNGNGGGGKTVTGTYTDPETGDVYLIYSDGSRTLQAKGTKAADAARAKAEADAAAKAGRQSAFDLLFQQFAAYGLQGLVEPLRGLIESGVSPAEFTIKLRETDAYKKRFAANQARIQKGLRALSEAEYIGLEDQYQDVMRRYGLPDTYYARGDMGRQEGFEKFIGGDVSPVELEDRIQTAQRRVINAAPEVTASLRSFYPEIGQGDLLAYFLDPDKAIENIKRKVTAAEIGGAATMAGLTTGMARAEELGRYGVTGEAARQGFQTIAEVLPRGSQLAEIYKQSPYTQTTAEQEVFGLAGATEASKRRRQLTQLEQATFSGQAGAAGGALGRERAGAF